jgi:hypothetical protein
MSAYGGKADIAQTFKIMTQSGNSPFFKGQAELLAANEREGSIT